MLKFTLMIAALVTGLSACSHAPQTSSDHALASQDSDNSSVEIRYTLRHTDRRLKIESDPKGIHGQSLVDGSQLKQCQIDPSHYQDYLTKVKNFVTQRRSIASTSTPGSPTDCRAPYTITLKNQKDTLQLQGCRTQDEGGFSHLVQEGEFLIYRQK